jgi:hypothetical protein
MSFKKTRKDKPKPTNRNRQFEPEVLIRHGSCALVVRIIHVRTYKKRKFFETLTFRIWKKTPKGSTQQKVVAGRGGI